jgi:hypothetical protein
VDISDASWREKGEERSALVGLEDASLVRRWLDTDQPRRARKG